MLTLITNQNKAAQQHNLDELAQKYQYEWRQSFFELSENDHNQYLIYCHKEYGVIGGAKITPPQGAKPSLEACFEKQGYELPACWQMSHVFFSLPDTAFEDESHAEADRLCKTFYQELYQALYLVSMDQNIPFWFMLNHQDEHEDTKVFGGWGYDQECLVLDHAQQSSLILGCISMPEQNKISVQ